MATIANQINPKPSSKSSSNKQRKQQKQKQKHNNRYNKKGNKKGNFRKSKPNKQCKPNPPKPKATPKTYTKEERKQRQEMIKDRVRISSFSHAWKVNKRSNGQGWNKVKRCICYFPHGEIMYHKMSGGMISGDMAQGLVLVNHMGQQMSFREYQPITQNMEEAKRFVDQWDRSKQIELKQHLIDVYESSTDKLSTQEISDIFLFF